eukprot:820359-Rhodomonas_salina.1
MGSFAPCRARQQSFLCHFRPLLTEAHGATRRPVGGENRAARSERVARYRRAIPAVYYAMAHSIPSASDTRAMAPDPA